MRALLHSRDSAIFKFLTVLNRAWRFSLFVSIGGLVVRLFIALIVFQQDTRIESLILAVAGFLAGRVDVTSAWFGLLLFTPCLNAFTHMGIPFGALPVETVAGGVYLSWLLGPPGVLRTNLLQNDKASIALDVLASIVMASIIREILVTGNEDGWAPFLEQPYYGFGSPWFGLSSGLVLVLGFVLFRTVTIGRGDSKGFREFGSTSIIFSLVLSLVGFGFYQLVTWIPEPYGTHLGENRRAWVPTLPGDDIHTFGTMAAVVLAYSLGYSFLSRTRHWIWNVVTGAGAFLVLISWSRAAWIAGIVAVLGCAWLAKRRAAVGVILICVALLGGAARFVSNGSNSGNPYVGRFASLVDVGKLAESNRDRIELYKRAVRMAIAHPFTGVGIGNYYRLSPQYASANAEPQTKFTHNAMLQLVSELGFGAAVSCGVFLLVIFIECRPGRINVPATSHIALWLATCAFAVTQLTANAVNIFCDQQLIFMYLCAAVYRASYRINERMMFPPEAAASPE